MDEQQQQTEHTDEPTTAEETKRPGGGSKKGITGVVILIVIILLGIGAFFFLSDGGLGVGGGTTGEPVAVVNSEAITRLEFDARIAQISAAYQAQGVDLANQPQLQSQVEQQVLETMVNELLILQYADEQGISVGGDQVASNVESLKGQYESEAAFQNELERQQLTEEDLNELVLRQLTFQEVQSAYAAEQGVTVTDEEIQTAYAELGAQSTTTPPLAEVRGQIEQQLTQQKEGTLLQELLRELRADAEIEVLVQDQDQAAQGNTDASASAASSDENTQE